MWLLFLALHVAGLTGYNLLLRKSLVKNVDRWTLATIMQTGIALPMVVALFIAPPDVSLYTPEVLLQVVITALLVIALHVTNVKSLQYLEAGVYSVLFNLRILITTFLGILFLGEDIIWLQILGGVCIFLAVLTVRQKGGKQATLLGIQWGIAAALAISFLNFAEKALINNIGYLPYTIPVMLIATTTMWAVVLLRKQKVQLQDFTSKDALALMGLRAMSMYGATLALYLGATLSVYTYISSLSVVATVIFGVLLLGEKDYLKQKFVATGIAVVGLSLILWANLV